jgi:hypothetical protein
LLHPEGLREQTGDGPADPLRRAVKVRSTMVKRRTAVFSRLDAHLELLGPAWYDALGSRYGKAALALLARYADPNALLRLASARLTRFLIRYSRGAWREEHAGRLLAAARQSLELWGADGIDFAELAADIAVEAEQAQVITEQIEDLDERIASLYELADPKGIISSAPGVGPVIAAVIAGPRLAAKYVRLMATDRHHDSALCHIATALLTRIATCWRTGTPYVITDVDGTPITAEEGRRIVQDHHQVDHKMRNSAAQRRVSQRRKGRADRERKESQSAPASRPAVICLPALLEALDS